MSEHYFGFTVKKARKDHRCEFCFKKIRKNTKYHYHSFIYDGSYNNYKHHRLCTFMSYHAHNDYTGETNDISEYSHPEDRRNLINVGKLAIKEYKTRWNGGGV